MGDMTCCIKHFECSDRAEKRYIRTSPFIILVPELRIISHVTKFLDFQSRKSGFILPSPYPLAQLFPEPCFWLKWELSPYLHLPDFAAILILWLITLGSISISTALATRSGVGKNTAGKHEYRRQAANFVLGLRKKRRTSMCGLVEEPLAAGSAVSLPLSILSIATNDVKKLLTHLVTALTELNCYYRHVPRR